MASVVRQQVIERFGNHLSVDEGDKLLNECVSICVDYNISPDDLYFKWEAQTLDLRVNARSNAAKKVTMDDLVGIKTRISRDLTQKNQTSNAAAMRSRSTIASVNKNRLPPHMQKTMQTPQPFISAVKTENTPVNIPSSSVSARVAFKGPAMDLKARKDRSYRYMYEKINERSEVLDDRINEFGNLIMEHYGISELGDPNLVGEEDMVVVGRIVHEPESAATMPKITEATMALETARRINPGLRIPIRFDPTVKIRGSIRGAATASFFPGAIVALKGKNGGAGRFLVTEILTLPSLKPASSLKTDPETFTMCISCGPYTHDSDLSYAPWRSFLKRMREIKPAVLLLLGPFIDVHHSKIKEGDVDVTPEELFYQEIIDPLRSFLDSSPGSIALILPNVRGLVSGQVVYPQAELSRALLRDYGSGIHMLPNPAKFTVNGVSFAATSLDVLYHLKNQELSKRAPEVEPIPPSPDDPGTDSLANTCRILLQQRSFYPLFPAPGSSNPDEPGLAHDVNLSVTHLDGLKLGDDDNFAPDVLITPSRLKHFSKTVQSTIAINPSFLTKGTYATLNVVPGGVTIKDRISTEIQKLEGS